MDAKEINLILLLRVECTGVYGWLNGFVKLGVPIYGMLRLTFFFNDF